MNGCSFKSRHVNGYKGVGRPARFDVAGHFGRKGESIFEYRSVFDFKRWKTDETVTSGGKAEE